MSIPISDLVETYALSVPVSDAENMLHSAVWVFSAKTIWEFVDAVEKRSIQMFLERVEKAK